MQYHHPVIVSCMLVFACTLLVTSVSAAGIQASMGEIIPLSGYSYGSQTVYLFLTGPNLPVNGVALHDISQRADQGGFTRLQVDSNDRWSYKWGTGSIGGRLDEGTYTIWVVNGPNDRSQLSGADYSTITVTLGQPSISADTPRQPGAIELHSVPGGASIVISENYKGKTPLTVADLPPGTYDVTFSQFGYQQFSTRVPVESGRITEVNATLVPNSGALAITSVPAGAMILVDGKNSGTAPVTAGNLTMGNHTVEGSLEGYTPMQVTVAVLPGRTLPITVNLSPSAPLETATRAAGPGPVTLLAGCMFLLFLIRYVRRE